MTTFIYFILANCIFSSLVQHPKSSLIPAAPKVWKFEPTMTSTRTKAEHSKVGRKQPGLSSDSPPPSDTATPGLTEALTVGKLHSVMDSFKVDFFGKIDSLNANLRSEISAVKDEFRKCVENIQSKLEIQGATLSELERSASDHSTRISDLEANVESLTTKVTYLDNRCEDMESRMRRNNIRLLGVPEGVEGPRPTEFIAQLLQELLGLGEKPLLDRAHRTLRSRPGDGQPPRPFVIRVHFFHVRNEILKKSGEASPLQYKGKRVSIFADYTTAVAKKRACFGEVKRQLRACPGVKFGLLYPAVLRVTLRDGSTHRFEEPALAADFIKKNLKTAVETHSMEHRDT